MRWLIVPVLLVLIAAPLSAQEDEAGAREISVGTLMVIASRVREEYPFPLDLPAINDALVVRGREMSEGRQEEFDRCIAGTDRARGRELSLMTAVNQPTMCAAGVRPEAEEGRIAFAMAEELLGQLEGENSLYFQDEVPELWDSADQQGLRIERRGGVLVAGFSAMPSGVAENLRAVAAGTAEAIVLDLRGNEGGTLDDIVAMADMFLGEGQILRSEGRRSRDLLVYEADEQQVAQGVPLVVLVDGATASGAEMVAAALQDHGRAMVIGSPTTGSALIRTMLPLDRQSALVLVTSLVYRPSGELIHGHGVDPDCKIDPVAKDIIDTAAAIVLGLNPCPASADRAPDDAEH